MVAMIWGWISAIPKKLKAALAGAVLAFGLLFSAFMVGRQSQKDAFKVDGLEDYKHTREKIDEVDPSDDPDAALERLRRNGWLR